MKADPFNEVVTSKEELRALLGAPGELAINKVISYLDKHCLDFIAKAPLLFLATSDAQGNCDVSPRGDQPGFVLVLDDKRLVIPERPGNKRFDSLGNILENPRVGLLFIIPGLEETLRINGRASIIKDKNLLQRLEAHGKPPLVGVGVAVDECFIHCAKSFKRANLWEPATWLGKEQLPKAATMLADHARQLALTEDQIARTLKESYENRLY